jgi:hypothetical protein
MRSLTLNCTKQQIFTALRKIAQKHALEVHDEDSTTIYLQKSSNLLSFGNSVECKVYKKNDRYIVYISSQSLAAIQVIDWGLNENIEDILASELKSLLS